MLPFSQNGAFVFLDTMLGRIISFNSIKRPLSTKVRLAGNSAGILLSGNSTKISSSAFFWSLDNLTVGLPKRMSLLVWKKTSGSLSFVGELIFNVNVFPLRYTLLKANPGQLLAVGIKFSYFFKTVENLLGAPFPVVS